MKNRKNVFVVGAGASADFGFPVGRDIANKIQYQLDLEFREGQLEVARGPITSALGTVSREAEWKQAAQQLRAGIGPGETIDQFLFRRRTNRYVRDLGVMTLAHVILDAEHNSQLMGFDEKNFETSLGALRATTNSWPAVLLEQTIGTRSPEDISVDIFSDIAFVIFNYDRCVEQTLLHHLHRRHNVPLKDALEMVLSIPMIHVYGVLGEIDGPIPFGATNISLSKVSESLRTYHEGVVDDTHAAKIHRLIDDAERIVFLGFGFHSYNVRLLFKRGLPTARLMGTCMQMQEVEPFASIKRAKGSVFLDLNCTSFIRSGGWDRKDEFLDELYA